MECLAEFWAMYWSQVSLLIIFQIFQALPPGEMLARKSCFILQWLNHVLTCMWVCSNEYWSQKLSDIEYSITKKGVHRVQYILSHFDWTLTNVELWASWSGFYTSSWWKVSFMRNSTRKDLLEEPDALLLRVFMLKWLKMKKIMS